MARKKQITGPELRAFRSAIATLKSQGLIPGKKVDARSARPFQKRGGKSLESFVKKFKSVTEGRAQVVTLPRAAVIEQHKMGRKSVGRGRVLIPKDPTERLVVSKKTGAVTHIEKDTGIKSIELPFKLTDKGAEARAREVAEQLPGKKWWGYEVKGAKGTVTSPWNSLDSLISNLKKRYKRKVWAHITIISGTDRRSLKKQEPRAR